MVEIWIVRNGNLKRDIKKKGYSRGTEKIGREQQHDGKIVVILNFMSIKTEFALIFWDNMKFQVFFFSNFNVSEYNRSVRKSTFFFLKPSLENVDRSPCGVIWITGDVAENLGHMMVSLKAADRATVIVDIFMVRNQKLRQVILSSILGSSASSKGIFAWQCVTIASL